MKYLYLLFCILLAQVTFSQNDHGINWDLEDIICKEHALASHSIHAWQARNEFAHQTDMHYQLIHWEIDPAEFYIKGRITYYFRSLVENLQSLVLDFNSNLLINSIERNSIELDYVLDANQLLWIDLEKVLQPGDYDTLTIDYEGSPPTTGFGSFRQGTHSGAPIVWTLSEPYGARDWWPAKQDLIDKVDSVDIFITTPDSNLAASNGKLISITPDEDKLIHHWRHRYPITAYLIALSVTNYAAYSQYIPLMNGDSIEMLNYVYPETLDASKEATKSTIDIMQLFNELFGIYPFADEKYGHAQFGWGGGMEHQTMSFMGNFSFGLQAHELAHQWFGDKVTCGSWQDIWLNEGFATYMTGLTYERFSPDLLWPSWKNNTINNATSQPGGSVWVNDTTSVDRIFSGRLSYNKASYLLHMMRWITGDSLFFQACRNYLEDPANAYAFGRTAELRDHFENTSGKDFDGFLQDWFYGQGYPSYHLRWTQQEDSLIVWVDQDQSHPDVNFFEMPLPIQVVANGDPQVIRVDHTYDGQRFSIFVGDAIVDSVGFDPDRWILSKNNTVTQITTSISRDDRYNSVIVYPNPASSKIHILSEAQILHAWIIDAMGRSFHLHINNNAMDLSDYASGIYTLHLHDVDHQIVSINRIMIHD